MLPRFKAAAVHAAPVFLDRTATTEKAISILREAARAGAELIAFPETYIPAFPVWAALWAPIDNHDLFVRMADQSVSVDGPEVKAIRDEARSLGIMVSIGISEKSPASVGAIWNSQPAAHGERRARPGRTGVARGPDQTGELGRS